MQMQVLCTYIAYGGAILFLIADFTKTGEELQGNFSFPLVLSTPHPPATHKYMFATEHMKTRMPLFLLSASYYFDPSFGSSVATIATLQAIQLADSVPRMLQGFAIDEF
jgi:hypothetical protein